MLTYVQIRLLSRCSLDIAEFFFGPNLRSFFHEIDIEFTLVFEDIIFTKMVIDYIIKTYILVNS